MPRLVDEHHGQDAWPMPETYSDHHRRLVEQARDPGWLRARAARCRDGRPSGAFPYLRLRPAEALAAEAVRCEARAEIIEAGGRPADWYVVAG